MWWFDRETLPLPCIIIRDRHTSVHQFWLLYSDWTDWEGVRSCWLRARHPFLYVWGPRTSVGDMFCSPWKPIGQQVHHPGHAQHLHCQLCVQSFEVPPVPEHHRQPLRFLLVPQKPLVSLQHEHDPSHDPFQVGSYS